MAGGELPGQGGGVKTKYDAMQGGWIWGRIEDVGPLDSRTSRTATAKMKVRLRARMRVKVMVLATVFVRESKEASMPGARERFGSVEDVLRVQGHKGGLRPKG